MKNLVKTLVAALIMTTLVSAATTDVRLPDAAMNGDSATVYSLLKQPATDVNAAQGDGSTALLWVSYDGDVQTTQALLKAGASVKAVTRIGSMSPLFMAAKNGNPAVVEALLNAGA